MRIYLDLEGEELIKQDEYFSKVNYGSRKNFFIETAILEKCLIFDNSILSMKLTIYILTDLQLCYDRQLANIGGIVKESVGKNRKAMKLFIKTMPNFNYNICTGYGIS